MPKHLSDLARAIPASQLVGITSDALIAAPVVEVDSDVRSGSLFVARKGHSVDGHDFIPNAIENGAAAVVTERTMPGLPVPYVQVRDARAVTGLLAAAYYDFPSRQLTVIGITGTDGKTTAAHLLHSILDRADDVRPGIVSTIEADLGGAKSDTGLHVTTPGAPRVQTYLAHMLANDCTHSILETTSHGITQGRLNGVDIDVAVLTNVTHEHLDYHNTWEDYRDAKAGLFHMLSRTYRREDQPKVAVINADDPSADYFAAIPADRVARYGVHHPTDFRATDIDYRPDGTHFTVEGVEFALQLVGEFNVLNALAALAAAHHLGVSEDTIRAGLADAPAIAGRMQRIDSGQDFIAIVDFAHTPNALKRALEAGRAMLSQGQRLIAVFGSAGLRDVQKRRLMAETSAQLADITVLTAEDPRTESLADILQTMADGCIARGGVEDETFIRVPDRGEAIYRACQMATAGDVVMVCGKGHEQSMCFGTTEYPWDDREALRSALRGEPLQTLPTASDS